MGLTNRSAVFGLVFAAAAGCSGGDGGSSPGSKSDPIVIDLGEVASLHECGVDPLSRSVGDEMDYFELRNRGIMNTAVIENASAPLRISCYSDDEFIILEDESAFETNAACGFFEDALPFYFVVDGRVADGADYDLCFFQD